jgi:hypothetical protein
MAASFPSSDIRSALKVAFSPFLDRAALHGRKALSQMADDLRVFSANAGCVVASDLELLGWTPAQITRHGTEAARTARARSERAS